MTSISNELVQALAFNGVVAAPLLYVVDESAANLDSRERLLDASFGAARFEKTVERLREGRLPAQGLALAAKDGKDPVCDLRMWQIRMRARAC